MYILHYVLCLLGWKGGDQGGRPKSVLFVEELTGLISENLPDLWKLGQTYLNKTLFQVTVNCSLCKTTSIGKTCSARILQWINNLKE